MKQIQIDQQFGQIGLNITPPDLKLRITRPDLQLDTKPADLQLSIERPEVLIDLRESFNSMGLQDPATLTKECAEKAQQTLLNGIERRVKEGEEFSDPQSPSVAKIVSASAESAIPKKELVLGLMPSAPPKISAKLGSIKGEYAPGDINVRLRRGELNGTFAWGRVDVYLEREPYIDIRV